MSRHYYGDIEGGFLFDEQPSDVFETEFGAYEIEHRVLYYYINKEDNLPVVYEKIKEYKQKLNLHEEININNFDEVYNRYTKSQKEITPESQLTFANLYIALQIVDYFEKHPDSSELNVEATY